MRWDLEEKTENAIASYLTANLNGEVSVYTAWGYSEDIEYPAVIIFAGSNTAISDPSELVDPRNIAVQLSIITEAAPLTTDYGVVIMSARERNIQARTKVIDLLAVDDLVTQLIDQGEDDVAFSMAQLNSMERSVEDRHLITLITLDVIAEPVTGS